MRPVIKNKKSEGDIVGEGLLGIIIWATALLVIFIPLGLTLYKVFSGQPNTETINSLDLLAREIKYLEGRETLPLYVDKDHMIKGFDIASSSKPSLCSKDFSCLCICKLNDCTEGHVSKCTDLEYDVNKDKLNIGDDFVVMPTEKVTNYEIGVESQKISLRTNAV